MRERITRYIIYLILLINICAVISCVHMGAATEDVSFLFQEREAITFLSGLQLGFISILSLLLYFLKSVSYKAMPDRKKSVQIWLFSFALFALATSDELFMMHEGIDGDISTFFFNLTNNPHLDGIVLSLYAVVGLFLFAKFRDEIFRHKTSIRLFLTGGLFFLMSIILDLKSVDKFRIVLEESAKIIAISFLLSGFVVIMSDHIAEIDHMINRGNG